MGTYTLKVDSALWIHYKEILKDENCIFQTPEYTFFQAKNKNWQFTFYKTGKILVQGKEIDYIVQKYLDKNYKNEAAKNSETGEIAPYPHIGIDESGKGDFFGPLVIAGCYLTEENALILKKAGITDSKKLDDKKILVLAEKIKELSVFDVVVVGCGKYNELYKKFKNLNLLLAWGHSTVLENILSKTSAKIAISDKFADDKVILSSLKEKGRAVKLIQQTKAESDTAVAAASILARAEFVKRVDLMCGRYEMNFPKGAGENVILAGEKFVQKFGINELKNVSKTHFKTYEKFLSIQNSPF